MAVNKKWLALIVEVETHEDGIYSILPVDAETAEWFTKEELAEVHKFLKEDDDASFDFMWDFRALIARARDEEEED